VAALPAVTAASPWLSLGRRFSNDRRGTAHASSDTYAAFHRLIRFGLGDLATRSRVVRFRGAMRRIGCDGRIVSAVDAGLICNPRSLLAAEHGAPG
jgi:hypothetical protein